MEIILQKFTKAFLNYKMNCFNTYLLKGPKMDNIASVLI